MPNKIRRSSPIFQPFFVSPPFFSYIPLLPLLPFFLHFSFASTSFLTILSFMVPFLSPPDFVPSPFLFLYSPKAPTPGSIPALPSNSTTSPFVLPEGPTPLSILSPFSAFFPLVLVLFPYFPPFFPPSPPGLFISTQNGSRISLRDKGSR